MKFQGNLHKMHAQVGPPIRYQLELSSQTLLLNDWLGKLIRIEFLQNIECVHCGRKIKKSFNQGFCYPCFISLAQCDLCIMSPERCHYHLGTCREPEWGLTYCMKPHIVYLSNTSGVKVGITRETQIPTRWIDQGARQAMPVLRVSKRYYAGLIETAFKKFLNDKTNWRTMLKNEFESVDLFQVFETYWPEVQAGLDEEVGSDVEVMAGVDATQQFEFPVNHHLKNPYPTKITSFNLDKNPVVEGKLNAIKGQYLIMDTGVINIRKFSGYLVSLEVQ